MGYETKMFFVDTYGKENGFFDIVASVDLCKTGYEGAVYEFVTSTEHKYSKTKQEELNEKISRWEELNNLVYNKKGNHAKTYTKKLSDELWKIFRELENELPYIHIGRDGTFRDSYHELLQVVEVKDILEALEENAKTEPYRRFTIAIKMCKEFKKKKEWPNIKVVLYGH